MGSRPQPVRICQMQGINVPQNQADGSHCRAQLNQEQKPFPRLLLFFNPVFSPAEGTVKLRPTKERKNRIVQLAVKYTAVLDANDAYHGSTNRQSFRVGFWVVGTVKLVLVALRCRKENGLYVVGKNLFQLLFNCSA